MDAAVADADSAVALSLVALLLFEMEALLLDFNIFENFDAFLLAFLLVEAFTLLWLVVDEDPEEAVLLVLLLPVRLLEEADLLLLLLVL